MRGNPLQGSAEFIFDKKPYRLVLDNRVWLEAEEILGYSIIDVVEEIRAALDAGKNPKLKHIAAVVYGGLKQNHPEITEALVIDMFFSGDPNFRKAVMTAMRGAQVPNLPPDTEAVGNVQKAQPTKARKAGIGKRSSKAGAKRGSKAKTSG